MNPKHIYLDDKKADDTQRHERPQGRGRRGKTVDEVKTTHTSHSTRTIAMAFSFVFQVKYLRSNVSARNTFTISSNMEARLWCMNSLLKYITTIANFLPVKELSCRTPYSKKSGMLMSAFRKFPRDRFAISIFGKVRRFLNRVRIPITSPLPTTEKTTREVRSATIEIVSGSMIFLTA